MLYDLRHRTKAITRNAMPTKRKARGPLRPMAIKAIARIRKTMKLFSIGLLILADWLVVKARASRES